MKTQENLDAIMQLSRFAYFELKDSLEKAIESLEKIVCDDIEKGAAPQKSYERFENEIGRWKASVVIASLVNANAWDGRISKINAEWASYCSDAFDESAMQKLRVYTKIHISHLDQLADVIRKRNTEK